MLDFHLPPTTFTPEVSLDLTRGLLALRGESYPENVLAFYAPVLERIRTALGGGFLPALRVDMHITYYNSASAKAFHRLFQLLNKAAENGAAIQLYWHYDEEDDMARDLGNDLREDFQAIEVVEMPLTAA
jgi:SiaC family regulatory phosphoprotein